MVRMLNEKKMQQFKEHLIREEKSQKTIEKYLRDLGVFCRYAAGAQITKGLTVAYKKYLQEEGKAVSSINSMLASVNSFLEFAGWQDCKIKHLKVQRQIYCPEDKELTKAEYFRLLDAAKKNNRLQMIIQTICATGIRISELQYFTVENTRTGEVRVNCKNKTRVILVPGKLKKTLLAYARKSGISSGRIFVTRTGKPMDRSYIWAQMKKLCNAASVNPSKVFPHNLRKLFAKTFYGMEKDIAKLADILGHSSIETTRIYIKSSGYEHRMKLERMGLLI